MDPFEDEPSWGFEPSSSREQVFTKDKPSPLRIIKRRHSNGQYDARTYKSNYAVVDPNGSPSEPLFIRSEFPPTLKLPRRRPKGVSGWDNGYRIETSTGLGRPLGIKGEDRNFSACTLPSERNIWLDVSSRASSRCTNYELKDACHSTNFPILSNATPSKESSVVLSPHIRVVPETVGISFGQQHIWAAVEVSGRLSQAGDGPELGPEMVACSEGDTASKFGYLYDVIVDALPMPQSLILQIIRQQDSPATMFVGSSMLLLVHVLCRPGVASSSPRHKHLRQRSEELMEDLEMQLGDIFIPFLNIQVTYSHSAFPCHLASAGAEMSSIHTKLRTTAEATVKLHNALSPWSPQPVMAKGRLLPLMRRHWGAQRASEVMEQMVEQRSVSSPVHTGGLSERLSYSMAQRHSDPADSPAMSTRRTSLQGTLQMTTEAHTTARSSPVMRLSCDSGIGMRGVSRGEVSVTAGEDQHCEGVQEQQATVRRRRPVTPIVSRNPTPSFANSSGGERNQDSEHDNGAKKKDNRKQGATGNDGGKRKSGLWTWASWF
ncbi:hypothetical protein M419DRAFT_90600 [Trichoderma reesei RUT C-30]|uniref:Uncharacterized protein n=1 Tax=Hypocrea jecorina (strain ATCC 56765 / BCRC 32924 / NRRL 11460 / Rut C-30) TaxID=1344414 RepID=A0A024RXA5_HYPJR|nr:hypothetical protein M419DRAFT_90600 [Trichoderma reesei RUT C-30]